MGFKDGIDNRKNMIDSKIQHVVCLSGGHSSGLVAIEVVRHYGKENVILLNHNIAASKEDKDIKRFKKDVADYLGIEITYANIDGIMDDTQIPDQFDVCMKAGALTDQQGHALCTSRLKTEPFYKWLAENFIPEATLFDPASDVVIYYGFDIGEPARITRRSGIMAAKGYKTSFILAIPEGRTIFSTKEIGIEPPLTYSWYEHANCEGCLKASLLHWYVTYVRRPDVYAKGIVTEEHIGFAIHTIIRNKVKRPIFLTELAPIFDQMLKDGIEATEHQSKMKFANLIRKYQLEECNPGKPCECITN